MAQAPGKVDAGRRPADVQSSIEPDAGYQPVSTDEMRPDREAVHRDVRTAEPAPERHRQRSPAEIERDIEHTRDEMGETIDAIEWKLDPRRIRHEVEDSVHDALEAVQARFSPEHIGHVISESASNAGRDMIDRIKENPIPSLVAGLSIGWLMTQGRRSSSRSRRYPSEVDAYRARYYERGAYGQDYYDDDYFGSEYYEPEFYEPAYRPGSYDPAPGDYYEAGYAEPPYDLETDEGSDIGDRARGAQHRAEEMGQQAKHRAEDVGRQAQQMGRQAKHRAENLTHQAQNRARRMARGIEHRAEEATDSVEHFVRRNPLAAGAIAAGVGAFIASMLPSTEYENEFMGNTRDRVVHRAEHMMEESVDRAGEVAMRTKEEAMRAASDVAKTAREEAQNVAQSARQGAGDVKETAKREATGQS